MQNWLFILELIGTMAFAASGALTGIKKHMDIFGVAILGLTTAVGGGIIRDVLLGFTPPSTFRDPVYALFAIGVSIVLFLRPLRESVTRSGRVFELSLLLMDSLGLGVFTVVGVQTSFVSLSDCGVFLPVFMGVVTGVGGGVMRDIMAGDMPYVFVKHIYACASLAGALLCVALWHLLPAVLSMLSGIALVVLLRLLSAKFKWNLPKA